MLRFAVVTEDGLAREWTHRQAHLLGADDVPVQSDITFEPGTPASGTAGVLTCEKSGTESAALSVQVRVEAPPPELSGSAIAAGGAGGGGAGGGGGGVLGVLSLRTCLLPDRSEPYLLSLELARHRIMMFLNKLESWSLFDLPAEDPVMKQFERARALFTAALVAERVEQNGHAGSHVAYTAEAESLARQALALAVDAGERLALRQVERQSRERLMGTLHARAAAAAAAVAPDGPMSAPAPGAIVKAVDGSGVVLQAPPAVGVAINPAQFSEPLHRAILGSCDFITMPMRWVDLEPQEGEYAFTRTDRWIEWAVRTAKVPIVGGPVIDFRPSCVPDWLYIWEHDYETLRELVYEHVRQVVTRYRRTVSRWTIASGLHVNRSFAMSFEQVMDLTRICVLMVRKLQPTAKVQLEITQPWGEYAAENKRSIPPLLYAEMVNQAGISVDSVALRVQMGQDAPGRSTRDLMAFSDLLDRYAVLEKPIALSAVGCPSEPTPASDSGLEPGQWRAPWSPAVQADWMTKAYSIAIAKPFVQSVCWQDLYDLPLAPGGSAQPPPHQRPDMPHGGLMGFPAVPKTALQRLAQIRAALREFRSPLSLAEAATARAAT